eukprot:814318_1
MVSLISIYLNILVINALNDIPTTSAEKLAYMYGLETNESKLFLDNEPLVNWIQTMLDEIYSDYPSIENDGYYASMSYEPNTLLLAPKDGSKLYQKLGKQNGTVFNGNNFISNITEFDRINAVANLDKIKRR